MMMTTIRRMRLLVLSVPGASVLLVLSLSILSRATTVDGLTVPVHNGQSVKTASSLTTNIPPITVAATAATNGESESQSKESDNMAAALKEGEKFLGRNNCNANKNSAFQSLQKVMRKTASIPTSTQTKKTNNNYNKSSLIKPASHLTFSKFLTMQEKRVVVCFRFTDLPYLRPYFLTFANKLKKRHADIIIDKRILPLVVDSTSPPIFEVLVDGKIVIGNNKKGRSNNNSKQEKVIVGGRVDATNTQSVFASMEQLGLAIAKARRRRRPNTLYGGETDESEDSDYYDPYQNLKRRIQHKPPIGVTATDSRQDQ
ncbi:expressed unknown protein [Seminavis robusta]|uniref:Uncharacterized protein n=1 Tax=Seminavis robusta TaxID=568900 RepID=A0A9N8D909_9STRA|nr:expressed unknown protein [Seminavis robusta]|eukprot:Sro40_g024910.1 n/a (314) ;mRNA; r:132541-133482